MTDLLGAAEPSTGELLGGRYRLIERIGSGGMGRVYRANDEVLGRDVAIKLFHTDGVSDADAHRKVAEARVLASLNHPSLVTLFDARVGQDEHAYLVMEFVDGVTLRQRIDEATAGTLDVALLVRELATALDVVHAAGIVHRDVKPSNVLLRSTRPGVHNAVLADFGVAHLVDATRLTSPGTVIGTAAYLAPEQVRGEAPVPASDIYALGLLALETLTGRHPFGTDSMQAMLLARLARQPEIPGELGYRWKSLLSAMTAMDPAARPTAAEVAERAATLGPANRTSPRREHRAETTMTATAAIPMDAGPASEPRHVASRHAAPRRKRRAWIALTALGVAVIACAVVLGALMAVAQPPTTDGPNPAPEVVATTIAEQEQPASPVEDAGTPVETVLDPAPPVQQPVVTEPVVTEPVVTDPVVTEPVVTEPETSNPNKGPDNNNGNGNGNGNDQGNGNGQNKSDG